MPGGREGLASTPPSYTKLPMQLLTPYTGGGILVLALAGLVLLLRKRPAAPPPQLIDGESSPKRRWLSIRSWRIMTICLGGMLLLLFSHLVIKDKENILFLVLHEIGFALIVSLVVWALFEAQLSQEAEEAWDQRIERVTKNVFQAVLRKDLPKALLDEANNLILNSSLTRSSFTITYTLRDEEFDLEPGKRVDCVVVEALMEFTMRNVSTDNACWKVNLLLPNPVHSDMKRLVAVHNLIVTKGGENVGLDLEAAREAFERNLTDNAQTAVAFEAGEVMLRPGESCDFSASYVMAKEAEDTEFLSTLYPADGLRVTIFDNAGDTKRVTFARSVHRQPVERVSGGAAGGNGAKIFRVSGYLLPHQGVLIWWKRTPSHNPIEQCAQKAHGEKVLQEGTQDDCSTYG